MEEKEIKRIVREGYARIAERGGSCCGPASSCCGSPASGPEISRRIGYSEEDLKAAPEGANLGLGCGNPVALASLTEGDTVLDLGSGAGFDCFLAASKVGKRGKVIGVDMTGEMLDRARENARKGNYDNVDFRLGEIENLPVGDNEVDVVISNCVINLSPNKRRVFREAFRVLRSGGRLMVSDIVLLKELPVEMRNSVAAYVGCVAGAVTKKEYLEAIQAAGFGETEVLDETVFPSEFLANDPTVKEISDSLRLTREQADDLAGSVVSIKVSAVKPAG
ncbi:MAG TPA: arsenite methyltransferase [Desulfatiglandales bacterium]|nr:arsenite methyltransferase [Desulfatiglandales bacterium]